MFMLFPLYSAEAQSGDNGREAMEKNWYVGVQGGMPFSTSDFSSFGDDETHPGFTGGVYGGYRFNEFLSLEANLKWGLTSLSERTCCAEMHYWLGSDGVRYHTPVIGMDGWDYGDLKSTVFMQSYGLQLNVNVLGFFRSTRDGRWTLDVSPVLSAVCTTAELHDKRDGGTAISEKGCWHLGAGGNLQVGYQVAEFMNIGVFSGLAYLTGKALDGIPEGIHSSNYIWESGIRIGFIL